MTDRACVYERLLEGTPDYNEWQWRSQRSEEALPQSMHRPLPSASFISEKSSSTIFLHSLKESIESLRATFFQTAFFSQQWKQGCYFDGKNTSTIDCVALLLLRSIYRSRMISINTYRYNRTLLYNMYIAYHIQSNLETWRRIHETDLYDLFSPR